MCQCQCEYIAWGEFGGENVTLKLFVKTDSRWEHIELEYDASHRVCPEEGRIFRLILSESRYIFCYFRYSYFHEPNLKVQFPYTLF